MSKGSLLSLVGGLAAAVAVFLPWFSILGVGTSVWGLGAGYVVLVAGALGAVFGVLAGKKASKGLFALPLVCGLIVVLVVISNYPGDEYGAIASATYGYWISLAGGVVLALGGVLGIATTKK